MSCGKCEAATLFWGTPELVEHLLPFLDADSTKELAEAHHLTRQILGKALIWGRLTKRTFPLGKNFHLDPEDMLCRLGLF